MALIGKDKVRELPASLELESLLQALDKLIQIMPINNILKYFISLLVVAVSQQLGVVCRRPTVRKIT